jgi:prepilin-type processing-associated H-X9-DG protein
LPVTSPNYTITFGASDYFTVVDVRSPMYSANLTTLPGYNIVYRVGFFFHGDYNAATVVSGGDAATEAAIVAAAAGKSRVAGPKITEITDGLSNTVMVGENAGRNLYMAKRQSLNKSIDTSTGFAKLYSQQNNFAGGGWADPQNSFWVRGSARNGNDGTVTPGNSDASSCGVNCTNKASRGFYSWHDGGAHFLMGDGSVRFMSETADNRTLASTVTRAGQELETMQP